jgi:D-xylose transport system substrate-binding protein
MKRIFFFLIVISACFLQSCSKNKQQTVKIGLLMDDYAQDRWEKDRDVFIAKAKELGGDVILSAAKGDERVQLQQAKDMLKKGVDVIVLVPVNLDAAADIINEAHNAGVKVLSYDRLIRKCDLDFYISFDNIRVGELQAEYFIKLVPKGNYVLLGGPISDNNSLMIKLGQMNVLQPLIERGDIKVLFDQHVEKWDEDYGYGMMKTCLSQNKNVKLDVVIAANDALARGAVKAMKEVNLAGKVFVAGQDAEPDALQRIAEGTQTITIYKPIESIASAAAQIAVKLARNENIETGSYITVNNDYKMVPSVLLNPMIVNKETIKLTIPVQGN